MKVYLNEENKKLVPKPDNEYFYVYTIKINYSVIRHYYKHEIYNKFYSINDSRKIIRWSDYPLN